jgi:hypothetical protein
VTELDVSDVVGDVAKSVHDISAATGADPVSLSASSVSRSTVILTYLITGVALNCVAGRGFFEETEFGSETYKNTELSRLTSAQHPTTLKDTIGLAYILFLALDGTRTDAHPGRTTRSARLRS